MQRPLSKIALAMTCLLGTTDINMHTIGYFDEGNSAVNSIHSGWSFGVNSAVACDDFNSCEHFEIIGNPIDEPDPIWGGIGFDDGSGGGSGGDHDDGGGSGGGGGGSNSGDQKSERQQCHERVQREHIDCVRVARDNHRRESRKCQDMVWDQFVDIEEFEDCEAEQLRNYDYDQQQCTARLDDDVKFCNTHFKD